MDGHSRPVCRWLTVIMHTGIMCLSLGLSTYTNFTQLEKQLHFHTEEVGRDHMYANNVTYALRLSLPLTRKGA